MLNDDLVIQEKKVVKLEGVAKNIHNILKVSQKILFGISALVL